MKKMHIAVMFGLFWAFAGQAYAGDVNNLLEAKGCVFCHAVDVAGVGPSYRDISHRYHGLKSAKDKLVRSVEFGTGTPAPAYHWGNIKMNRAVVNVPVSREEAGQMVDYILSLK